MVCASAGCISRLPCAVASGNAIENMVRARGICGPVNGGGISSYVGNGWPLRDLYSFLIGLIHWFLCKSYWRRQHQPQPYYCEYAFHTFSSPLKKIPDDFRDEAALS